MTYPNDSNSMVFRKYHFKITPGRVRVGLSYPRIAKDSLI
jgi:hypothetical protein